MTYIELILVRCARSESIVLMYEYATVTSRGVVCCSHVNHDKKE